MIRALQWKFSARDFDILVVKVPIFQLLMKGKSLEDVKLSTFKEVFFAIIARIASSESVSTFHEVATNHPFLSLSPVGFNKLENLEAFNKVKAMCVFNNALKKIEGMDHMTRMQ